LPAASSGAFFQPLHDGCGGRGLRSDFDAFRPMQKVVNEALDL